eukprot:SAG22_NODE_6694_length_822_cov_1.006916_1_plen_191_part_00
MLSRRNAGLCTFRADLSPSSCTHAENPFCCGAGGRGYDLLVCADTVYASRAHAGHVQSLCNLIAHPAEPAADPDPEGSGGGGGGSGGRALIIFYGSSQLPGAVEDFFKLAEEVRRPPRACESRLSSSLLVLVGDTIVMQAGLVGELQPLGRLAEAAPGVEARMLRWRDQAAAATAAATAATAPATAAAAS